MKKFVLTDADAANMAMGAKILANYYSELSQKMDATLQAQFMQEQEVMQEQEAARTASETPPAPAEK